MAHQSLYRKYRPQRFDDVVGQDHITRTLRNAVEENAVAHAYLFTGPRGTGKTTTARILAKALDCEKGPTGDPDDTCESCRDITEGRHPDVYELDAASRTGVDAVRDEIITKVAYATTRGGWKVYIIDEVHMLSTSAFNALLKTLEEPPSRTVFVLCTTHPQKVPETIQSRCQRFDFRRISVQDIDGRLASIAEREGISVEDGVLPLIARHAAGGMRDAIGTLDQLAAFTGSSVTLADVEGLLGEVDAAMLREVIDLVAARDAAGAFRFVARLAESGMDVPEFVRNLTQHVRDLYVTVAAGDAAGVVDATGDELERLREQAGRFEVDRLARLLDLLGDLGGELRWAPDPRLALEVALTRMARPASDLTLEALAERVAALEAGGVALDAPAPARAAVAAPAKVAPKAAAAPTVPAEPALPARPAASSAAPVKPEPAPTTAPAEAPRPAPRAGTTDRASLRRAWPDVVREIKAVSPVKSKYFLDAEIDVDGDEIVIEFAPNRRVHQLLAEEPETKALVTACLEKVLGVHMGVRTQLGRGGVRHAPAAEVVEGPLPVEVDDPVAADDAERKLIDGLGAEVIIEHPLD